MLPKLIAIVGPTASGKTALGIEVAKLVGGEVISVDSRMIYRGMNVGTAKPEEDHIEVVEDDEDKPFVPSSINILFGGGKDFLVEGIPHWGIDLVNPDEDYSVAQFKTYAEKKISEILKRGRVPILVGGTGMWLSAIVDNLDLSSTPSDEALRQELETRPISDLFAEYKRLDPVGAETIDRENKRRVLRALEVTKITGKPFSQLQTRGEPKYDVLQIGLNVDREVLNERINDRVDEMIGRELVTEVRRLKETYGCAIDAMTGIGYRQVCEFLDGRSSLKDAIEQIKIDSRHYAKRQMTWFKRDLRIHWIQKSGETHELVKDFLTVKMVS